MFLFQILCVFSSFKIIENVAKHSQTTDKNNQSYEIDNEVINEDEVNENLLENGKIL